MKTGKSEIIAGLYNGKPFNLAQRPSQLTNRDASILRIHDTPDMKPVEQPIFGVYRIDPDGSVHLVVTDAGKPNGVAVSPDSKSALCHQPR